MPYAFAQSETVQKIIGKRGELLTGQYVHSESGGNLVTYERSINID